MLGAPRRRPPRKGGESFEKGKLDTVVFVSETTGTVPGSFSLEMYWYQQLQQQSHIKPVRQIRQDEDPSNQASVGSNLSRLPSPRQT